MTDSGDSSARRDHGVVLVLSTGRCGTQWLAANLGELHAGRAAVTHEPIGPAYRCRTFFRGYDRLDAMAAVPEIAEHLQRVAETAQHTTYVETGWPLFSAVPLFLDRFGDAVRIVHLTRHPVPTAISHMVHKTYGGSPRRDWYTELAALDAGCPGVVQRHLAAVWDELTPYEKTLFWWTEVHLYAEELQARYPGVAFHRVAAEDMLAGDEATLRGLCDFIGLPYRPELAARASRRVDEWHHKTDDTFDWRRIFAHPQAVELAARLGYDVAAVDAAALDGRYRERAS